MDDIRLLARKISVADAEGMAGIVENFYPASRMQPKVWPGIQEVAESLKTAPGDPPSP